MSPETREDIIVRGFVGEAILSIISAIKESDKKDLKNELQEKAKELIAINLRAGDYNGE